jgi:hypothetical protein
MTAMHGLLGVLVTIAVIVLFLFRSKRFRLVVWAWLKPGDLKRRSDLVEKNRDLLEKERAREENKLSP